LTKQVSDFQFRKRDGQVGVGPLWKNDKTGLADSHVQLNPILKQRNGSRAGTCAFSVLVTYWIVDYFF